MLIRPELAALTALARGAELDDLPLLAALFTAGDSAARTVVDEVTGWLLAELAAQPLGQVPFRHHSDGSVTTLLLARAGGATLALQAIDGVALARRPEPVSVSFPPVAAWDHVLAGHGWGEVVRLDGFDGGRARLVSVPVELAPGSVSHRSVGSAAQVLRWAEGCLVTLKLQCRLGAGSVTREYRLRDGELLHQAAASARDSRLELTAALLGRMGRTDAAPLLAAMAEEQGSTHLRWQALRECLGLDTALGFAALGAVARRTDDPLAGAALALRNQLIDKYPELGRVLPCPA
ncbi:hypothetical protein [Novosphingobium sp.]|uniref:hypothetical protein n=1 Tax=Novosphingobium sp. TaxID=1874826 RepID=UPI0022C39F0A|nr:hypothetical protein [Novosphingobium sp.]MCZ8019780.1 hypothetical protein [Novosphingobium sp.]MCZ8035894.1 hypothetical protein [Novosphingobium sp.]MCZ8052771.1 hypothetical protein [Novosphingobium sp.]MCZ8060876.1 hypothetical protein [Novosphingobium sp.]MCZ8233447.1 hypothetical protein [Novosphingobium sp.]